MAKAWVEMDFAGEPVEVDIWTIDEYETFMFGTGEWVKAGDPLNDYINHPSGIKIKRETYETDFGDGIRL